MVMMVMMMMMMMMMTNDDDDDYDDCFLHTCSVEVYPFIVRSLFVSNYLSLEVHFPGVWNILVLRLHSHFSLSWPICNGWPTSQRFMFPGSFAWGEPGTYHICYCAYIIGLGLGELQLMMADVANHQRGTAYVVESCQSRRCQLCGTSRHQLPGFPARAGYRSRSGHTAVRELV